MRSERHASAHADAGLRPVLGGRAELERNWDAIAGLLITFDEYQVAPYVFGQQTETVPYSELKSMIDPHGPLGDFVK